MTVSEHSQLRKEAVSPKSLTYTVTKLDIWKAILKFLKVRNYLNEISSTSTFSLPRGSEHFSCIENEPLYAEADPQQVIEVPYDQLVAYQHRELTTRELHCYVCCTEDYGAVHEEYLVNGLDALLLQLSSYLYPPPKILGSLLKKFVLEVRTTYFALVIQHSQFRSFVMHV